MTEREQRARLAHKNGSRCSNAVYMAFSDIAEGSAPAPRSEDGKCGAVLSAEKILKHMGMDAGEFDKRFLELYGSLKCFELKKARISCNDLVGTAAGLVGEMVVE